MRKLLLILLTCIVSIPQLFAIPAFPYPIKYTQPDGSEITIQLKGDERVHWAETGDGFTLLSNGKNGWEYAIADSQGNLKKSGIIAHETNKRTTKEALFVKSLSKKLRFSKSQISILKSVWEAKTGEEQLIGTGSFFKGTTPNTPVSTKGVNRVFTPRGTKKLLMILIQYPDLHFTYTKQNFYDLMNTQNYNLEGAHGSVRDYFLEQSYGQFDIQTDVVGIYTAKNNMEYYGTDAADGTHDPHADELMLEAVQDADADVDFSQYDNDGDGSVDGVYIVYAGYGQASSGIANTIWPHAGGIAGQTFDGKTVSKYSCSNELNYNGSTKPGTITTIGVICHEFGHVCGAPDYYDTDYATNGNFPGTGYWDVMCYGVYNGTPSGSQPAHQNPFEKVRNGWITPVTLTGATSLSIPDITSNRSIYIYNTTTPGEYFMLENRQQNGFNAACPGHGLLIYKFSQTYWNTHANNAAPQGYYVVSANCTSSPTTSSDPSTYGTVNSASCPFPGTGSKASFTDATTPSAQSWAGANTGYPLTNIAENSSVITLCFNGCPSVNSIQSFKAIGASSTQINLSWLNSTKVIIARNTTNTFGSPVTGTTYSVGNTLTGGGDIVFAGTASSFSDNSGLSASTTYYYQIWATDVSANFSLASAANASTTCSALSQPLFSEGFEGGVIPGCWTQEYVSNTYNWTIATKSGYSSTPAAAHSGSKLALFYDGAWKSPVSRLITPPLDLSDAAKPTLKFWHTQAKSNSNQDILYVYYRTSATADWVLLQQYNGNIQNWTLESMNLPNPSSTYYIAFEGHAANGCGICLDDVEVWKDGGTNKWIGITSTDWFTASNWSAGVIPTSTNDVEIPSGTPYSPIISTTGAVCNNITIDISATVEMGSSSTNDLTISGSITNNGILSATSTNSTINIAGDWTNNGIFNYGTSSAGCTVIFNGTNDLQTIGGTTSSTGFYNMVVNKGSQGRILEVKSVITLNNTTSSGTTPLNLSSGTFKLSSASTITPFNATPTIQSSACLWNNGGTINPTAKNIFLYGSFRNSAGVTNFGNVYSLNGMNFTIEGGIVNISGYLGPQNGSGTPTVTYNQSGGILNLNVAVSYIPFNINTTTSTFNMSGGTIAIQKASTTASDYQNLAGTNNVVTGGMLQIGNGSTATNQTIHINSTAPIYNLTVNSYNAPTAQLVTNPLTVLGDVTIGSGAKLDLNSLNLSVGGNWTNNGGNLTATPTGTITFNGSNAQSIGGSAATTFNNLSLSGTSEKSVILLLNNVDATVDGALTFTYGVITTGNNKLIIPASGSVSRTSGHVNGNLQKNVSTGTAVTQTYEIGDATNYTPASVSFANVSTAGTLTGSTTAGDHPQIGSSTLDPDKSINRYWTLTNNGIGFTTYDATFNFVSNDLDASANTSNVIGGNYASATWSSPAPNVGTKTTTSTQLLGLNSFGDFAFAEKKVATGIADVSSDKSVLVYRNTLNQIVVSIASDDPSEALISVYNSTGQTIARKRSAQAVTVLDAHLQAGVYMVAIQKSGKVLLKKIVIN
ncbi:M6 family metalloprotease domain-containing protein [Paludibacter sp.]|uniref:M6 family metalloprotease domain-containing protein n=1 Tax=Paludibacter sp. TaxID=1898105 RepID=UPI001355A12E|nr:M6 family metalloprotease domain-containing protein [Paludibacter sp.]MTK52390.1 M6 family metalloprotease domain-containing protein [Paludibacter sp.]